MRRVAVLPGDGVGAEVTAGPLELLSDIAAAGRVELTGPWPVGASAFGAHGTGLPPETVAACDAADALFLGAIGEHPASRWRTTGPRRPSSGCGSGSTCGSASARSAGSSTPTGRR